LRLTAEEFAITEKCYSTSGV